MQLHILGMNGPFPAPGCACSGYLLTAGDARIQLDMGTGTLAALTGLMPPEELTAILVSHWHFDHTSDLLPLIYRLKPDQQLHVYGPADDASPVRAALAACPSIVLHTIAPGDSFPLCGLQITVFEARHPVPAVMYRMTDSEKVFAFTGDTNTTADLPALMDGADLLLADGLFTEETWAEGKPHLSAALAAKYAAENSVKQLVLTHFNPELPQPLLLAEARACYPSVKLARCGDTWKI